MMEKCKNECVYSRAMDQVYPRRCVVCGHKNEAEENKIKEQLEVELSQEPMLQFFNYQHLPEHLKKVSEHFCKMAEEIVLNIPRNPERTAALRKLLEAKDCAVRALIYK